MIEYIVYNIPDIRARLDEIQRERAAAIKGTPPTPACVECGHDATQTGALGFIVCSKCLLPRTALNE